MTHSNAFDQVDRPVAANVLLYLAMGALDKLDKAIAERKPHSDPDVEAEVAQIYTRRRAQLVAGVALSRELADQRELLRTLGELSEVVERQITRLHDQVEFLNGRVAQLEGELAELKGLRAELRRHATSSILHPERSDVS